MGLVGFRRFDEASGGFASAAAFGGAGEVKEDRPWHGEIRRRNRCRIREGSKFLDRPLH